MYIKLVAVDAVNSHPEIKLRQFPVVIGRSAEADLSVNDVWVSRRHCELFEQEGRPAVRDLGSTHGTYLNGAHVNEAVLQPGDRLTVGISTYRAVYEVASARRGWSQLLPAFG